MISGARIPSGRDFREVIFRVERGKSAHVREEEPDVRRQVVQWQTWRLVGGQGEVYVRERQ